MKHDPLKTDDAWENDAVWKLLDHATPTTAGPRFLDNTTRAARLSEQAKPWWKRVFSPAPLAGLTAATAALVFSVVSLIGPASKPAVVAEIAYSAQATEIQDIAETETLIAAVDHLDDFSDRELVSLIGF